MNTKVYYLRFFISEYNLSLCNSVGIIDSGYRDTIKIRFNYIAQPENYTTIESGQLLVSVDSARVYKKGDKIAQLVFADHVLPKIQYVNKLKKSERGMGGFGSTGK